MVGEVKWQDDGRFVFQALGGGASDPGLTFSRSSKNPPVKNVE
jgi:hypothetical protein